MRAVGSVLTMLVLATGLAAQTLDVAGFDASRPYLTEGTEVEVRAKPADGKLRALRVVYRPGSDVTKAHAPTIVVDDHGVAKWTPKCAGLAELLATVRPFEGPATEKRMIVSVKFASAVSSGLFVMIGAAVILFGGAFLSIRALLRAGH